MKHSLPSARLRTSSLAFLLAAGIASNSGCVKLPRTNLPTPQGQLTNAEDSRRINLNGASIEELETLPGIGKGIAERIVAHREEYGPFRRVEHLMMVRGISDEKFRAVRDKVTIGDSK